MGSAALPKRVAKRLTEIVAPGVLCQWAPDGVQQFPEPKRVVKFSPDGGFAFFADSATGVPVSELEIHESPSVVAPGVEAGKEASEEGNGSEWAEALSGIVGWLRRVLHAFQQEFRAMCCRLANLKRQAPVAGTVGQRQQGVPGRSGSRLDSFGTVPAAEGAIVGIDLGTTHSRVAVMQGGAPRVIANLGGDRHFPSVVFYGKTGGALIGDAAGKHGVTAPERTITSIKRILGKPVEDVMAVREAAGYSIVGDNSGNAQVVINGTAYSPERIASEILVHLKELAEQQLRGPVSRAVVAVPAHFTNQQRNATRIACELAGFKVERLINEPTAAALNFVSSYYSKPRRRKSSQRILVFDLGGGSCDVSLLETDAKIAMVLATHGDTSLGGDDFREVLVNYVTRQFLFETGIDLRQQASAMPRIREACERAKVDLSSADRTVVEVPFVTGGSDQPCHMRFQVTRELYEYEIRRLVQRCHGIIGKVLRDSGLSSGDMDEILLVGGMTQTPRIRQMIGEYFDKNPCRTINPLEEVVAGAAVQAGILDGVTLDTLLLDVTPFSLSIETEGGIATSLVEKNTTIPIKRRSVFSTAEDNQTEVTVSIFEGEDELAKENRLLGEFNLEGIPRAARGVPQIEVVFDIDANGILSVGAKELGTGKEMVVRMS